MAGVMRASVVINERSSRSKRAIGELPAMLAARGIDVDRFEVAEDEAALRKRVKKNVKDGASLVIVGGGDGAMTVAADVLARAKCALGVLPLGTGNSFALTLGISDKLETALDVIVAHRVVKIDLGTVNETHFANFATIGLSAEIADRRPTRSKSSSARPLTRSAASGRFSRTSRSTRRFDTIPAAASCARSRSSSRVVGFSDGNPLRPMHRSWTAA